MAKETAEAKKAAKEENDASKKGEKRASLFDKEQLCRSARYAKRRDLLHALLKDGRRYSFEDVDAIIAKFMKGKVN